ncbi:hypothetical protein D047_0935A, partial [Vibrio parahaemolyticus VPTS-2010_2]
MPSCGHLQSPYFPT